MTRRALPALVATLVILAAIRTHGQDLSSKAKGELKRALSRYAAAKTDEQRTELFPLLFLHGRAGIAYLETVRDQKATAEAVAEALTAAPHLLGVDLLERRTAKGVPAHAPGFFAFDEIVLVRTDERLVGFLVPETGTVFEGKIQVKWWSQQDGVKKLLDPGGSSGEEEVTGAPSAKPMKTNSGYQEYDFDVTLDGVPVRFHFIGPAYFRIEYRGSAAFALTGEKSARRFRGSDPKIGYSTSYPPELARARELVQDYVFRTVPGCEALPLDEADRSGFAQYEAVQIVARQTRPEGHPVLLVRFISPETMTFAPHHAVYIENFAREILPGDGLTLLLCSGAAPNLEGNLFWDKKGWEKPSTALVKTLRSVFPEEY